MFFFLSKILWFVVSPFNLALFALTGAMIAMHQKMNRLARRLGLISWLILVVFGVLPTGQVLTGFLESRTAIPDPMPRRVDGIIVLGGAINTEIGLERGTPQLQGTVDRLNALADLGRRYPWAKLVFTSGDGSLTQSGRPEGDLVRQVLASWRFYPGARLIIENKSRTTYENVKFSKDLVQPQPDQTWLLVTSASHMPRALGVFRAEGWAVIPYPTDYITPAKIRSANSSTGFLGNMELSHVALKEILGIAVYTLTGRWSFSQPVAP